MRVRWRALGSTGLESARGEDLLTRQQNAMGVGTRGDLHAGTRTCGGGALISVYGTFQRCDDVGPTNAPARAHALLRDARRDLVARGVQEAHGAGCEPHDDAQDARVVVPAVIGAAAAMVAVRGGRACERGGFRARDARAPGDSLRARRLPSWTRCVLMIGGRLLAGGSCSFSAREASRQTPNVGAAHALFPAAQRPRRPPFKVDRPP